MERGKRTVLCWASAGAVLSLCVLITVFCGLKSHPRFLASPSKVMNAAEEVLNCARAGDLGSLSKLLYGEPSLGNVQSRDSSAQSMIWYAYLESIQYSVSETIDATDTGVSLSVTVTCLDISTVIESLKDAAPALMAHKASQIDDESIIYDESHNYREAFVAEVLQDATEQILQKQPQTAEHEVTLQLVRSDEDWQVVPTDELLQLLTGFVSE